MVICRHGILPVSALLIQCQVDLGELAWFHVCPLVLACCKLPHVVPTYVPHQVIWQTLRYESLIACISMDASCINVLSLGCLCEQDIPSAMTETKQLSILLLVELSQASLCSHIVVSAISHILSGRASLENLCRSNDPLNISFLGLFPVNISSNSMPRL
jgi:hypothetical protein